MAEDDWEWRYQEWRSQEPHAPEPDPDELHLTFRELLAAPRRRR